MGDGVIMEGERPAPVTSDDERAQVAAALDATPELLPWLPELLADLWDLGSSPALVAEWLGGLDLPPGTRALDLGCGKGVVSLTLARDLGFQVHGVDLFEPFLLEARARAADWGLADACRFEKGDVRAVVRTASGYDVVVYASVGALGPLDECVRALRTCVREGGLMVVHEGFLAPGAGPVAGFANLAGYGETLRRLKSHGDEILREHVLTPEDMRALDERYINSIERRAKRIAAEQPAAASLALGYVDRQRRAATAWERAARSAAWLLRKSRGDEAAPPTPRAAAPPRS
jgi:cyclopropane fatty-acyl-phospholipid synthase-like methyltransferase